jgi:hypothetical protein
MLSSGARFLLLSLILFLVGAILIFLAVERGSSRLVGMGLGAFLLSVPGFWIGARKGRSGRNPLERRREQRLWKSGPLGRKWLEGRRRIP